MGCPDLELLERHAREELSPEQRSAVSEHVSTCAACRERLALVHDNLLVAARVAPGLDGPTQTVPPRPGADPAPPANDPRLPPDSFPGYQILREISRGGQGVVYQAIQQSTRRKVAIKVLREGHFADASERARFEREVQILGQLKHSNIVSIYDSGSVGGNAFYVMDYISGKPLDEYVREQGTGSREQAGVPQSKIQNPKSKIDAVLRLFAKVCDAVHEAHLKGIIHRDLKPSNIRVDTNGEPHVLDFGLAKLAGAAELSHSLAMTMTGQFLGSLPWSSPEQAEGQPSKIDIRTDVYALGVILYQLLTGRFPYDVTGNMRDVLDRIMHAEPTRPSTVHVAANPRVGRIDEETETIVLKCLAKERDRRYQSAGELARDIGHYLAGEPIEAKRDSAGYILCKALRRYRVPAMVAAGFVLLLAAAAITATVLWRRATAAETRARSEAAIAEEINRFLNEDFLAAADRGEQQGRDDVTVREVLDSAAQRLEQGWLREQPLVEAAVRTTVGKTYRALGSYRSAQRHLEIALRLRQGHLAHDDLDIGRSYTELALVIYFAGDHVRSEGLAEQAISIYRARPGSDDVELAGCLALLSDLKWQDADLPSAGALGREALRVCARSRPSAFRDRTEVMILDVLSGTLVEPPWAPHRSNTPERLEEAEMLARRALLRAREVLGPANPRVATIMDSVGWILQAKGSFDEAERLHRDGFAMREKLLGPDHTALGASMWHLAQCFLAQGRLSEAESQFRDLLAFNVRTAGEHWYPAMTRIELGAVVRDQQRYGEAAELLEEGCRQLAQFATIPNSRRAWTFAQMVALYESWHAAEPHKGHDQKAAEWRVKLRELDAPPQPNRKRAGVPQP